MTSVLFLCVHNSARSQMAEAFLKKHGGDRFQVESADLESGRFKPFVVRAMAEGGIDISGNPAKSVFHLFNARRAFQAVVAVCSQEDSEQCPMFPGLALRLPRPFADPSSFAGNNEHIMARVREVRDHMELADEEPAASF